jgi:hypothetical protein
MSSPNSKDRPNAQRPHVITTEAGCHVPRCDHGNDFETGLINWLRQIPYLDALQLDCGLVGDSLPRNTTLYAFEPRLNGDIGMAVMSISGSSSMLDGKDTVVISQNNGVLHA